MSEISIQSVASHAHLRAARSRTRSCWQCAGCATCIPSWRSACRSRSGSRRGSSRSLAIDGTGLSASLRGGDELTFVENAHGLTAFSWNSPQWLTEITTNLHVAVFAAQDRLLDSPPTAMRMVQIGIAMFGLLLLIAAAHELAGPRAGRLAAWVLMLEPAGIFFDSALHKEPLMLLASGIVVYGAARIWRKLDYAGILIAAAGGAIAVATRGYAGWFLVSGVVLLILHAVAAADGQSPEGDAADLRGRAGAFLASPSLLQVSSPESLKRLQASQDANADPSANREPDGVQQQQPRARARRLLDAREDRHEPADAHRGCRAQALPVAAAERRARCSERSAAWPRSRACSCCFSTPFALAGACSLSTAPILYPLTFLLIAYALSAGNAGTGFRYRTHIVTLSLAMLIVLRSDSSPVTAGSGLPPAERACRPRRAGRRCPTGGMNDAHRSRPGPPSQGQSSATRARTCASSGAGSGCSSPSPSRCPRRPRSCARRRRR